MLSQTEMWWSWRHLLTSARPILYRVIKLQRGLPLQWLKQACKGFIWPWRQSFMSFMWPMMEWINSLILTLKRAHKTNYRDGVSDYIRLFVYGVEGGLVYSVHCVYVCVWGGLPVHTFLERRQLCISNAGMKWLQKPAFIYILQHTLVLFLLCANKKMLGRSRSKDTPGAPPDKLQCKWYWLNLSQHEKDEGGGWLVLLRTISLCLIHWFNGDLGGHNEQVGWGVLWPGACCLSYSGRRKTKQVWCKLGEAWGNHLRCQLTLGLGGWVGGWSGAGQLT